MPVATDHNPSALNRARTPGRLRRFPTAVTLTHALSLAWIGSTAAQEESGTARHGVFVFECFDTGFFPEEVEDCLNGFPGVRESRVFGRPHPRLGEVPCAEIALDPGTDLDGLKTHCARMLSPYKVPLEFTVVDAVARTPGGKILRRAPA